MSNDNVECVHWKENDPPALPPRKKTLWILLAGVIAVVAVAVGVSLALFLPEKEPPENPPVETGQAIATTQPIGSVPGQTQPASQTPEDPAFARGKQYYESGNYTQALAALNQAVAAQPESGPAYTYRGLTQFQLSNYQAAVQDFTQAMIRMGESAELCTMRGTSYYMQALYPEAIADLTRGIELNPGNTNAYTYRALAYEATGRLDMAAADRAKIGQ